MSATRKTVELFYDVVSPYTWFAFEVLCRYKNVWNIDLKLKPFFLGGVMQASGNRPPAMVPNKGKYLYTDIVRLAEYFNIPLNVPKNPTELMFEKGSLTAQRFLTAVDMKAPHLTEELSRQLWLRAWNQDKDIWETNSLHEVGAAAGLTNEQIQEALSMVKDQTVKDRLKQYTSEAMEYGAFGSPTMIAHIGNKEEMVFGSDRFPVLAMMLGEEWKGPLPVATQSKM